ncbi:MAG: hypothetical protein K1X83_08395 [Oligoflexia bacterium]|nr:hypothetical protein [Oligoflexia bacterium]
MASSLSPLPIVFTHISGDRKASPQLLCALVQARLTNPAQNVILISNLKDFRVQCAPEFDRGFHYENLEDYADSFVPFRHRYFHLSVNPLWYERFCFERWFILREFCRRNGCERVVYCDSDVLIYSDLVEALKAWQGADYLNVTRGCWSTAVFNRMSALDGFLELLMEMFARNSVLWQETLDRLGFMRPYDGAASSGIDNLTDMFAIRIFNDLRPEIKGDHLYSIKDGGCFDRNISISAPETPLDPEFEAHGDRKRLSWQDGVPYAVARPDVGPVRMHCLHYQGNAKAYMIDYFLKQAPPWFAKLGINASMPNFQSA